MKITNQSRRLNFFSTLRQKSKKTKYFNERLIRRKRRNSITKSSRVSQGKNVSKFDGLRKSNLDKDQATKSIQEDALVHGAEEGRDKLRKATGSRK